MSFSRDFERAVTRAAQEGAKELVMKNARAVKASMGSDGSGISFTWRPASGGSVSQLGNLQVRGPRDEIVQRFHTLLKKRMGN